jgi:hypothetical protein
MSKKNESKPSKPKERTPADLKNINIRVNRFGAIEKSLPVDEVNAFLNEKVPDKKMQEDEK